MTSVHTRYDIVMPLIWYPIRYFKDMDIAFGLLNKGLTEKVIATAPKTFKNSQKGPDFEEICRGLQEDANKAKTQVSKLDRSIEAFFIGPRGENIEYFTSLIKKSIDAHLAARVEYELDDARHITRRMKNEPTFLDAQDRLDRALDKVLTKMKDLTPPFFGSRYFGHMIWETTIPGIVGNFATLLYNPNNCAYEASPYTTLLEIEVMRQFAEMFNLPTFLGFEKKQPCQVGNSWGHLTCGGTIANCEAFWAARNCRFMSLSLRKYIENLPKGTSKIHDIEVTLATGQKKKLLELDAWEILNIPNDEAMDLYELGYKTIYGEEASNDNYSVYQSGVAAYSIGKAGLLDMYDWLAAINKKVPLPEWTDGIPRPKVFVSATAHYSIRKSLSILGLGESSVEKVIVDLDSRICIQTLKKHLKECLKKKIPVLGVVGIVGTTEESTVDDLTQILKLKNKFASKGLYYHFHIDGAYGGYFASMTKDKHKDHWNSYSTFVEKQLAVFCKADSITFDPHKTGYVPYTCGGIIYRNHRLRDNLSFSAPYIYTPGGEPNMSIYGVEGSKPGSSVTSVYLSLQVLPLVRAGHGELLERTMMNAKIFTASLYRVKEIPVEYTCEVRKKKLSERFECLMLPRLYSEKVGRPDLIDEEMETIKKISSTTPAGMQLLVKGLNNCEHQESSSSSSSSSSSDDEKQCEKKKCKSKKNVDYQQFYYHLGPDLNIVCYGLNFIDQATGKFNTSLKKYNEFNKTLIKLSKPVGTDINVRFKDLYVSETQINRHTYGQEIFNDYIKRNGLINDGADDFVLIRSTIMNAFFAEQNEVAQNISLEISNKVFITELVENGCETLLHLGWR